FVVVLICLLACVACADLGRAPPAAPSVSPTPLPTPTAITPPATLVSSAPLPARALPTNAPPTATPRQPPNTALHLSGTNSTKMPTGASRITGSVKNNDSYWTAAAVRVILQYIGPDGN